VKELLIIIGIVMVLQFVTGFLHIKYYQSVVRKMSKRSEGYLGVGMNQRKFKLGQVCIIVTDVHGKITECRMLSGLTVFSMFRKEPSLEGKHISRIDWNGKEKYKEVAENAIQMIKSEMNKRESSRLEAVDM
jgi:glucitol operon activator protein